ncbi:hypothetical protein ACHAWF_001173, partial [Thalassiosira exigua]
MYTNIDTDECLNRLSRYLRSDACKTTYPHLRVEALIKALTIVMRNNRMRFGNLVVLQLLGIAMGMAPAPTIANLFVALHEEAEILHWLKICVHYLCRFIDDGFGIWIHHPDP